MKTAIILIPAFLYLGFCVDAYSQCSCPSCRNRSQKSTLFSWLGLGGKEKSSYYCRKSLDAVVQVNEKKFKVSPPQSPLELVPLYDQIADMIPERPRMDYCAVEDFKIDAKEILKLFKEKNENTKGLKKFFDNHLLKIQKDNDTTYIPMLILRARDKENRKVWIIHMRWEKNEKILSDKSGLTLPDHLLSYALEYKTGKILYEEK